MTDFLNAQEMASAHPKTFYIPSSKKIKSLKVNDFVKICHNDERFWCKITVINKNEIKGMVDNDLVNVHDFESGDIIEFNKCNIYDILSGAK